MALGALAQLRVSTSGRYRLVVVATLVAGNAPSGTHKKGLRVAFPSPWYFRLFGRLGARPTSALQINHFMCSLRGVVWLVKQNRREFRGALVFLFSLFAIFSSLLKIHGRLIWRLETQRRRKADNPDARRERPAATTAPALVRKETKSEQIARLVLAVVRTRGVGKIINFLGRQRDAAARGGSRGGERGRHARRGADVRGAAAGGEDERVVERREDAARRLVDHAEHGRAVLSRRGARERVHDRERGGRVEPRPTHAHMLL